MALATGNEIRIAVIENDPLRLIGLRSILASEADLKVALSTVAEILSDPGDSVVLLGSRSVPDICDIVGRLKDGRPEVRILITGSSNGDEDILQAVTVGAKGYVHEGAPPSEFIQAIRVVHSGSVWAPRRVLSMFIERVSMAQRPGRPTDLVFTEREMDVLRLLVEGRSNREIGTSLGIEARTVKMHVARLMQKAGVPNRIALSVFVINNAILRKP